MTDFYINDNVTLSNNDGAWSLLLNGEASDLEGFLKENVHPEICEQVRDVIKKVETPSEEDHRPIQNLEDGGFKFSSEQAEDSDDEKNRLAREENEKRLAELEKLERVNEDLDERKKHNMSKKEHTTQDTQLKPSTLLDLIYDYVDNDVLEVFGDTGSGKTAFVKRVAYEASEAGKKVFYLDTERNLTKKDRDLLKKCTYKYTPVINEIDDIVQHLPAGDVVILDSIGFPVLTTFARMNMKQKGDALLKLIAIFGSLKEWAYKNNGIVLVTNQPESEFNKAPNHVLRPFGDKSQFAAKEIWETIKESSNPDLTKSSIKAFRSRSVGRGTSIAKMNINNAGVEVIQA